jgi:uncharacterized membrane protein HdeD (DUF308 family)
MLNSINAYDSGSKYRLVSWGVLVLIAGILLITGLVLFLEQNLSTIALTLISGLLIAISVIMLSQILRKDFT